MRPHTAITRRTLLRSGVAGAAALSGCLQTSRGEPEPWPSRAVSPPATSEPPPTRGTTEPPPEPCTEERIESDDPLAVPVDSRAAFRCRGTPFETFETLDGWIEDRGSIARRDDVAAGPGTVELTAARGHERARLVRRFEDGIDLSDRDLSLRAKLVAPGQEILVVQLLAPDRENRLLLQHPIQRRWGWTRLDVGPTREVGNPDLEDVREVRIGMHTGEDGEATLLLDGIRTTDRADEGSVVLTFDDSKASQYETAFPILERHGLPGVAGVIPWAVDDGPVYMTLDQLDALHEAGWDVVSHPQRSRALTELSAEEQETAIRSSKRWLVDHGFERGGRFIVWPYGAFGPTALEVASRYHHLGFCGARCPSGMRFTGPLTLTRLNANRTSVAEVREVVDLAATYDQLLAITFHQVGRSADQVSERAFERIVEHVDGSDLDVITASELWDRVAPGRPARGANTLAPPAPALPHP